MVPLLGIAGAVVGSEATVVAVCSEPPGDYDLPRLQGAFSELYGERTTCLVVSNAPGLREASCPAGWTRSTTTT